MSKAVEDIYTETMERFDEMNPTGAFAFAAGLAWQAGHGEGLKCPGCITPGDDDPEAARGIRAGMVPITMGGLLTLKPSNVGIRSIRRKR